MCAGPTPLRWHAGLAGDIGGGTQSRGVRPPNSTVPSPAMSRSVSANCNFICHRSAAARCDWRGLGPAGASTAASGREPACGHQLGLRLAKSVYMQFWRSVFRRRAPLSIPVVKAELGVELRQGNATHSFPSRYWTLSAKRTAKHPAGLPGNLSLNSQSSPTVLPSERTPLI